MEREDADVVGGPNLCPADAGWMQSLFAVLLGSHFTFGPSRARYVAAGKQRRSSEKELILCNLLIRRSAFEASGGFDEALYPNEENALMERIDEGGGKLWYDPNLFVERFPRATLGSFYKMLFRYGCGRAQQFRRHPSTGSLMNMAPAGFVVYLLWVLWMSLGSWYPPPAIAWWLGAVPGLLYVLLLGLQVLANLPCFGWIRSLGAAPLMPGCHVAYGIGFWRGCFGRIASEPDQSLRSQVHIDRMDPGGTLSDNSPA